MSLSQKWVKFFKAVEAPNLLNLIQHVFAVSPNNCFCERCFSFMKKLLSDERNRLSEEVLEAQILLRFNFEAMWPDKSGNCLDFEKFLTSHKNLSKLIDATEKGEKYKGKVNVFT